MNEFLQYKNSANLLVIWRGINMSKSNLSKFYVDRSIVERNTIEYKCMSVMYMIAKANSMHLYWLEARKPVKCNCIRIPKRPIATFRINFKISKSSKPWNTCVNKEFAFLQWSKTTHSTSFGCCKLVQEPPPTIKSQIPLQNINFCTQHSLYYVRRCYKRKLPFRMKNFVFPEQIKVLSAYKILSQLRLLNVRHLRSTVFHHSLYSSTFHLGWKTFNSCKLLGIRKIEGESNWEC